jgi:hypothetical protein
MECTTEAEAYKRCRHGDAIVDAMLAKNNPSSAGAKRP